MSWRPTRRLGNDDRCCGVSASNCSRERHGASSRCRRALPIIVPVSYRLVRDAIEIEATGRILTNAGANGHIVCFEADSSDADEGWSVIAIGRLLASTVAGVDPTLCLATTMIDGRRWSRSPVDVTDGKRPPNDGSRTFC